jgi:exopolyphosphatase/pppGpp-phosphohydrolase
MLVAEITRGELNPLARRYDSTVGLAEAMDLAGNALSEKVRDIRKVIESYVLECLQNYGVSFSHTWVFGTEAVRRLRAKSLGDYNSLTEGFDVTSTFRSPSSKAPGRLNFILLEEKDEAYYSLAASIRSLPGIILEGDSVLAIDQGAGSVELAIGRLNGGRIEHTSHKTYALGTTVLASELRRHRGDCDKLYEWVMGRIERRATRGAKSAKHTVILGSAITMLARVVIRRRSGTSLTDRYSPKEVHGHQLTLDEMEHHIHDQRWGMELHPRDIASGEIATVLAGLVGLHTLLTVQQKRAFVVCAEALRFGIAWELASAASPDR